MNSLSQKWRHPGGKLRELGPESLSDTELLAILISSGVKGKPAEKIADEILAKFGSFKGMANQPLNKHSCPFWAPRRMKINSIFGPNFLR